MVTVCKREAALSATWCRSTTIAGEGNMLAVADNWFGWQQHARGMGGPAGIAHTEGTG